MWLHLHGYFATFTSFCLWFYEKIVKNETRRKEGKGLIFTGLRLKQKIKEMQYYHQYALFSENNFNNFYIYFFTILMFCQVYFNMSMYVSIHTYVYEWMTLRHKVKWSTPTPHHHFNWTLLKEVMFISEVVKTDFLQPKIGDRWWSSSFLCKSESLTFPYLKKKSRFPIDFKFYFLVLTFYFWF